MRIVAFAADHQLPYDPSGLVGEGHGGEFGRLSLDQLGQPCRGMTSALANLLDHSRGADDQHLAQALIAGACDHAEPLLAGGGMILRCQPNPRGKIPARSERTGIGDLDGQQTRADRANGWDLREAPAQLILSMPSRKLRFELPYLH